MGWFSRVTHAVTHPIRTVTHVAAPVVHQAERVAAPVVHQVERAAAPVVHQAVKVTKPVINNAERLAAPVVHEVKKVVPAPIQKGIGAQVNRVKVLEQRLERIAHRLTSPADVSAFGGQAGIDARKGAVQDGPMKAPRPGVNPDAVAVANGNEVDNTMLWVAVGGSAALFLAYMMMRR